MFEVGMSALVLKICSEYAKSLGLNFPPCTQQEINAICEWVDKHTIKDMTISQDGYNVTFTFKTENDTTKEFTFTIPKKVDVDELEKVLIGSDSVVVERLEDNSGLRVSLAQSVLNDINSKLAKPANPTSESAVTMLADGTVGTKPLSEIGGGGSGGGKLYIHHITITTKTDVNTKVIKGNFLSTRGTEYDVTDDFKAYFLPGSTLTINNVTYGAKYYANMPSMAYREYLYFDITTYEESGGPVYDTPTFSSYSVTEL